MASASEIKEHMDVISSDKKTVGKVDHMEGPDKIKLTKQSSPDGQHHHFIPLAWVDHVDQHVHLNKSGADVTSHWQHGRQKRAERIPTPANSSIIETATGVSDASGGKTAIRARRG